MEEFIIVLYVVLSILGFAWFVKYWKKTNYIHAIKKMLSASFVGAVLVISGCASQSAEEKQYEGLRREWAGNNGKEWNVVGSDATGKFCTLVSTTYVGKDSIYAKICLMLSNSVKTQTLIVVSNADCSKADSVLFFANRKFEYIYLKKDVDYHADYVDAQDNGEKSMRDLLRPFNRGTVFVIPNITDKVAESTEVEICVPLWTKEVDFAFAFEPKNKLK